MCKFLLGIVLFLSMLDQREVEGLRQNIRSLRSAVADQDDTKEKSAAVKLIRVLESIPLDDWQFDSSKRQSIDDATGLNPSEAKLFLELGDEKVSEAILLLLQRTGPLNGDCVQEVERYCESENSPERLRGFALRTLLNMHSEESVVLTKANIELFLNLYKSTEESLVESSIGEQVLRFEAEALTQDLLYTGHTRSCLGSLSDAVANGPERAKMLSLMLLVNLGREAAPVLREVMNVVETSENEKVKAQGAFALALAAIVVEQNRVNDLLDRINIDKGTKRKLVEFSVDLRKQEHEVREFVRDKLESKADSGTQFIRILIDSGHGYETRSVLRAIDTGKISVPESLHLSIQTLTSSSDAETRTIASSIAKRIGMVNAR